MLLYFALLFLVLAIVAGVFGFSGIARQSAGIARILFFIFVIIFIVTFFINMLK